MLFLSLHRVLALVGIFFLAANASPASDPADALSQMPACGLTCLIQNAPAIGCNLIDIECQCASQNSTQILQPCLQELCTYDETFAILRVQATLCNKPHDSTSRSIKINAYVTGIIPVVAVIMRFASRYLGGNDYWWDDWLHLISAILVIPATATLIMCVESGIGRHIWDLSYSNVVRFGRFTYISTIFWAVELLLLKYSILCLYLRIFPNVWLKRAVFAFMAFTALFTLPLIGLAVFQCIPIYAIWDLEAQRTAKCIDWITVLRLTVVYEVIAETVLFSLPVPIVWKLQMKTSKKIQLMIFFGMGICVIAVSIARVPFLPGVVNTTDPTYTITGTSITGYAASAVAHVCATVPTTKNLMRFCKNGFKVVTNQSSSYASKDGYETSGKSSYKTLQDNKNGPGYSEEAVGAGPPRGKGRNKAFDPYRISTMAGIEEDGRFMELHPVQPRTASAEDQLPTIGRVNSGPDLDDSASNKTILSKDMYKG